MITLGILAHVDAGKTTLCERILFQTHAIRQCGRVDLRTAHLDSAPLERERGITLFASEAPFLVDGVPFTLLDTPGHIDFSSEMERVLSVLDAAVLVVSAVEGIQAHTETIWQLLRDHGVPVFFFLNKVDRDTADAAAVLAQLRARFSSAVCELTDGFTLPAIECIAEQDDDLLASYLDQGYQPARWQAAARTLVAQRRLFPCYVGSALEGRGVDALLSGLSTLLTPPAVSDEAPLQARVYRISHDAKGTRWTHLRVRQGCLAARQAIGADKVHELRVFNGEKSSAVPKVHAGQVCAASGLALAAGDGIGLPALGRPGLQPTLTAEVLIPPGVSPQQMLAAFGQLEEEDPLLQLSYEPETHQLQIRLMGKIQLEVLAAAVPARFGFPVSFGPCRILYQETIAAPVTGYGHFEPLRHYAEVHLRMDPAPRGSGLSFVSALSTDVLAQPYQNLIRAHLFEAAHPGLLTGAPLTDVRFTLTAGRAHEKHTEGGDFRQATGRAVRQGLEQAHNVLLEPFYAFTLSLPASCVGRALSDLQRMSATFGAPQPEGAVSVVSGRAPAACLMDYAAQIAAYTKGRGVLQLRHDGYDLCHDPASVIRAADYQKNADSAHPSSSVFCAHGAGFSVPWQKVPRYLHCPVEK